MPENRKRFHIRLSIRVLVFRIGKIDGAQYGLNQNENLVRGFLYLLERIPYVMMYAQFVVHLEVGVAMRSGQCSVPSY